MNESMSVRKLRAILRSTQNEAWKAQRDAEDTIKTLRSTLDRTQSELIQTTQECAKLKLKQQALVELIAYLSFELIGK